MRRIAVLTTSRADYGHLRWPLRALAADPRLEPRLIVTAAHLSPEFGSTVRDIEADGFPIAHRLESLLGSNTDVGMAKTIGLTALSLADVLATERPDILLVVADRYEMLAPAAVALALRIPLAHLEGGDVSEGAIDDAVRNALTKMSHLHFTPTALAKRRVIAMGEEPWRVHHVGAPSLDQVVRGAPVDEAEFAAAVSGSLAPGTILVVYHPVTLDRDPAAESEALFAALERVERPLAFCFPNADAGSREIIAKARELQRRRDARIFVNLPSPIYFALLQRVALLCGNSSSGIMETASLRLPTVDIGRRQAGRVRPANVRHAEPRVEAIEAALRHALEPSFRAGLAHLINPYGDGHAAERIAEILATAPASPILLHKRARPLHPHLDAFGDLEDA